MGPIKDSNDSIDVNETPILSKNEIEEYREQQSLQNDIDKLN